MYFIYTCRINLHIRGNGDYKKTEMVRTVSQAFDCWERPETMYDETNFVWQTDIVFKSHYDWKKKNWF